MFTEHAQKKFFFSSEIFRFATEIKRFISPAKSKTETTQTKNVEKQLKLVTMQKQINNMADYNIFVYIFLRINSGAKSVELSFYFYFARKISLEK